MEKLSLGILLVILGLFVDLQNCFVRFKRVIGGEQDDSLDYSFLAALIGKKGYSWDILNLWGEYQKLYCSGAIISDQWLVTAAHCFTVLKDVEEEANYQNEKSHTAEDDSDSDKDSDRDYDKMNSNQNEKSKQKKRQKPSYVKEIIDFTAPAYWKVRLSVRNLKPTFTETFFNLFNKFLNKSSTDVYYEISKVIRHPKYLPWYLENDIAVVKLKDKLKIRSGSTHPQIIPMTNQDQLNLSWPYQGQMCKVIGWGCKEFEGPIMDQLHSVNLPILNSNYCRKVYRTDINLTDHLEFCAGYYGQNKGICSGDSGGPLICSENGIPVLTGIVSATHIYDPSKFPGIFSRISYFRNWIKQTIETN